MAAFAAHYSPAGTAILLRSGSGRRAFPTRVLCSVAAAAHNKTVVIGVAADSGCGKSTFMRRLTSVLGGVPDEPPNPDSNTLVGDTATVLCLDDYRSLDRAARKARGLTALDPRANDLDLMYEQVRALKGGRAVDKPVYNHVTGLLGPPERVAPPRILLVAGLHPMYDERVRDLLDLSIYLDISDEVKLAWKIRVSCVARLLASRSS